MLDLITFNKTSQILWIFDLDGTLLDSIKVFEEIFTQAVPNHFGKILHNKHRIELEEQMLILLSGKLSKWQILKIFWEYAQNMKLSIGERVRMVKYVKKEINRRLKEVPLFPGTLDAIKSLRDVGDLVAINTSSTREEVDLKLAGNKEFLDFFEGNIITKSDIEQRKPHPESIIKASNNANIPLNYCVMVGDMPGDILAGKNAGTVSVLVLCGVVNKKNLGTVKMSPDFVFQNVIDVVNHRDDIVKLISRKMLD